MANLEILDTGYIRPTNTGTRLASGYMANSGSAISIKTATVTLQSKANSDATPTLNTFTDSLLNVTTVENPSISISGILDMSSTIDRALFYDLFQLPRTLGYKLVYYNSLSDSYEGQIITQLANGHVLSSAELTAFSLGSAYPHIHVFFNQF